MPELTQRQIEILGLLAEGRTNKQIGDALYLGAKTVRNHVCVLMDMLGFQNRTQLAVWAVKEGLV